MTKKSDNRIKCDDYYCIVLTLKVCNNAQVWTQPLSIEEVVARGEIYFYFKVMNNSGLCILLNSRRIGWNTCSVIKVMLRNQKFPRTSRYWNKIIVGTIICLGPKQSEVNPPVPWRYLLGSNHVTSFSRDNVQSECVQIWQEKQIKLGSVCEPQQFSPPPT